MNCEKYIGCTNIRIEKRQRWEGYTGRYFVLVWTDAHGKSRRAKQDFDNVADAVAAQLQRFGYEEEVL